MSGFDDDVMIALNNVDRMQTHTKRRKRRRAKLKLSMGSSAVRAHKRKAGRTGGIHSKKTKAMSRGSCVHRHQNPPWQKRIDFEP